MTIETLIAAAGNATANYLRTSAGADIKAAESIVTYLGDEPIPLGGKVRALGLRDAITWVRERTGNEG